MRFLTDDDAEAVRAFVRTTNPESAGDIDFRVGTRARALMHAFCAHRLAERDRLIARVERLAGREVARRLVEELVAEMLDDDEKH